MKFIAGFFFFKGFSAKQQKKPKKNEILTALWSKTHYATTTWKIL